MFLVFLILLQQLDGNFIGPRILGGSTGLSGMWVMFGILLFGGLWGIGGMIVGVPLLAVIYDIIRQLTRAGLRRFGQEKLFDQYNKEFHPSEPVPAKKRGQKKPPQA
jgi:predicted PurR-regulated permease PerM